MHSFSLSGKKKWLLIPAAIVLFLLLFIALDRRMIIREYTVEDDRITAPVRIALVTDLHSCRYGKNQQELIDAVLDLKADVLLLGGDIFDDEIEDTNTALFLAGVSEKLPCYYVTGNHEFWSGEEAFARKMAILEEYHVTVLAGECRTLVLNGQTVNLCGVDDPDGFPAGSDGFARQLEKVSAATDGQYTILLSHRPERIPQYAEYPFDLALCGHAHGGQWRIPLLLNGLYAPNQGLFPAYAGGQYALNGLIAIVSRGLARETTIVPRIFNRPELVLIEIR